MLRHCMELNIKMKTESLDTDIMDRHAGDACRKVFSALHLLVLTIVSISNNNYSFTKIKVHPLCQQTLCHLIPIQGSRRVEPRAGQTLGSRAPPGGSRSSGGA